MDKLRKLGKHPLIIAFFAALVLLTAIDILKPDKAISELENRPLQQNPKLTLTSLWENEWTQSYGEYIRDQFLWRDEWVSIQSVLEIGQGKLEAGGVWYAKDGYQIAKNVALSSAQQRLLPANTQALATLAGQYKGRVSVMIVPSPANMLSDKLRWSPPQIDENALIDMLYSQVGQAGAATIDLRPVFEEYEESGQEVYYHTDHHWTTDGGALLAYEAYCAQVGREALLPAESQRTEVPGFFGTNYAKTKRPGTPGEVMTYYDLPNPMWIYKMGDDLSQPKDAVGIINKEKLSEYDKYAAFLHGNNGYSVIEGGGTGSVLVVKDSYGNSFVPYLVENYAKVGVIDLRDWGAEDGIAGVMAQENYDEVLVLYSFASFSEDTYATRMAKGF